jgi:hypothetical protein
MNGKLNEKDINVITVQIILTAFSVCGPQRSVRSFDRVSGNMSMGRDLFCSQ